MMDLAIVVLKTGQTLIAATDQLEYEPKVHLVCPCTISGKTKVMLQRWPEHTPDEHILLQSDILLTMCEPTDAIAEAFTKKFRKQIAEAEKKAEPVVLNEENIPTEPEDDYEPRYVEETLY